MTHTLTCVRNNHNNHNNQATLFRVLLPMDESCLRPQEESRCVPRGAAAQFGGAVAVPSGPPGRVGSFDVGGGYELPAAENTLSGTQFGGAEATLSGPVCRAAVTHVTLLVMLLLLSVTTVVEVNGMDDVLCLGLLLALASNRAASALRWVLV